MFDIYLNRARTKIRGVGSHELLRLHKKKSQSVFCSQCTLQEHNFGKDREVSTPLSKNRVG